MAAPLRLKGADKPGTCLLCGKTLDMNKAVWLEMRCDDGSFLTPGAVPQDQSQGAFEFGPTCAKRALKWRPE